MDYYFNEILEGLEYLLKVFFVYGAFLGGKGIANVPPDSKILKYLLAVGYSILIAIFINGSTVRLFTIIIIPMLTGLTIALKAKEK